MVVFRDRHGSSRETGSSVTLKPISETSSTSSGNETAGYSTVYSKPPDLSSDGWNLTKDREVSRPLLIFAPECIKSIMSPVFQFLH